MLERLNGKSVSKAFSDQKFADIHYIRDMMLEVPFRCLPNGDAVMLPAHLQHVRP